MKNNEKSKRGYGTRCCQPFGPQAQNIKEYRAAQRARGGVDEYTKVHAEKGGHAARRQVSARRGRSVGRLPYWFMSRQKCFVFSNWFM